jgi:ATP-dependent DNA helicase RecG
MVYSIEDSDDPDEKLLELIEGGENETVEFKAGIDDNKIHEIVKTTVAFANQIGGIIIIGVNNDGTIDDSYLQRVHGEPRDVITNKIADTCSPKIDCMVNYRMLHGKKLTVVTVYKGKDKPYAHNKSGIYIRNNGTSRRITKDDLDENYGQKKISRRLLKMVIITT